MNRQKRLQVTAGIVVLALVLGLIGGLLAAGSDDGGSPDSTLANGLTATDDTSTLGPPVTTRYSDLPTISVDELPQEAIDTAGNILQARNREAAGQPIPEGLFPYPQDGTTFQNREGLLPADNTYKEYTVPTPGSDDRGARRLVVGDAGGIYYTDDHYESFREVVGV